MIIVKNIIFSTIGKLMNKFERHSFNDFCVILETGLSKLFQRVRLASKQKSMFSSIFIFRLHQYITVYIAT